MLIITAYHPQKEIWVELRFKTIKEAQQYNPNLKHFYAERWSL